MFSKAPNPILVVCATAILIAILGAYVFLSANGKDAAEISRFVNTILNFGMIVLTGVGVTAAGAAAKTSTEAKEAAEQAVKQTNGDLDARITTAIETALRRQNGETP